MRVRNRILIFGMTYSFNLFLIAIRVIKSKATLQPTAVKPNYTSAKTNVGNYITFPGHMTRRLLQEEA